MSFNCAAYSDKTQRPLLRAHIMMIWFETGFQLLMWSLGCIRPFLSLWQLNPQTNKQPADPRAILLLTTFRRQTFAISINEIKEGWGQWSLCCVVCRQSAAIWGATIWHQILMLCALAADKAERSGVCRSIDRRCVGGGCSTPHHLLPVHTLDYPFQLLECQLGCPKKPKSPNFGMSLTPVVFIG